MTGICQYVVTRGEAELGYSKANNYGGTLHAVRFRLSKPISLKAVGFFGPAYPPKGQVPSFPAAFGVEVENGNQKRESVLVRLEIVASMDERSRPRGVKRWPTLLPMIRKEVDITNVKEGDVWFVEFPPVVLPAKTRLELKFELQGKNNPGLKFSRLHELHPWYHPVKHDASGVEFCFLGSSRQIASLGFDVPNIIDQPRVAVPASRAKVAKKIPERRKTLDAFLWH